MTLGLSTLIDLRWCDGFGRSTGMGGSGEGGWNILVGCGRGFGFADSPADWDGGLGSSSFGLSNFTTGSLRVQLRTYKKQKNPVTTESEDTFENTHTPLKQWTTQTEVAYLGDASGSLKRTLDGFSSSSWLALASRSELRIDTLEKDKSTKLPFCRSDRSSASDRRLLASATTAGMQSAEADERLPIDPCRGKAAPMVPWTCVGIAGAGQLGTGMLTALMRISSSPFWSCSATTSRSCVFRWKWWQFC